MSNIKSKIELAANIAILIVSFIFIAVLIQKFYFPANVNPYELEVGSQVKLPEINWNGNQKTLILAMKKGCSYCAKSAGFYKKLIPIAKEKNVKIIAVLPGTNQENKAYLDELGLPDLEFKQAELNLINVEATPTLVLVDKEGKVMESWVGQLKPEIEQKMMDKL